MLHPHLLLWSTNCGLLRLTYSYSYFGRQHWKVIHHNNLQGEHAQSKICQLENYYNAHLISSNRWIQSNGGMPNGMKKPKNFKINFLHHKSHIGCLQRTQASAETSMIQAYLVLLHFFTNWRLRSNFDFQVLLFKKYISYGYSCHRQWFLW
jgi:hypothetical protein